MDPLVGEALTARFEALGSWLLRWRAVWSVPPFRNPTPAWQADWPELGAWLEALSPDAITSLELDPWQPVDAPAPWSEMAEGSRALSALGALPADVPLPRTHALSRRVKGRKWAQVTGFLSVVEPRFGRGPEPVVEGCSGRGHLGRTLAERLGREAILLERDAALCGPPQGDREHPRVHHVCVDVMDDAVLDAVPRGALLVGLHACGCLTDRLIAVGQARGASLMVLSPCCPHRLLGATTWTPASRAGAAQGLVLGLDDLRLAVLDEVVAAPRRRELRRRELHARVAVELLCRRATGEARYFGFPTIARERFTLPLPELVDLVRNTFGLPLPEAWDEVEVDALAAREVLRVRALALVRMLARRPVELWTVLDRAQGLVEAGREVTVGTFCGVEASPRNVGIVAR